MHHGPELRVVVVLCIALAVGALTRALGKRLRVPYTVAMLLAGVAAGGLLARFGDELHTLAALREGHAVTADLILFVFLPALVFESAFALDVHAFRKNLGFVALLAVPALVVATGLTAAWMVGLTSPALGVGGWAWGWAPALVFGALISATDPVAVVAILREVGAPKRLGLLIEGESLLNDGTAIVVFGLLIGLLKGAEEVSLGHAVLELGRVAGGGVVLGLVLGGLTMAWLGRTFDDPLVEITLTILLAYAAMILAEAVLHVSGVLAIVTAGVTLAGPGRTRISPRVAHFLHQFWEMLAYVANTVIFFLVGVVIVANLPLASLSSVLVGVGAYAGAMLVRLVVTFAVRPLGNRLVDTPVTTRAAAVMTWGGLRGAVSLALALLLSQQAGIDATLRAQILTVTAGVVLGTILLNGSTTGALLRKLGFTAIGPAEALAEARASEQVLAEVQQRVADADDDPALRTVPWLPVREALGARREALAAELDAARERFEAAAGEER
ncbi:MAG TPA: cation:proton antiporter, partial [Polyangiaceae bacterium LLY-WYZ-15_(1-7)]|nr:cation:proton antiporter [Polyangiaceae bacterium LLY-WYZ-15_(1-7)]